jgi:hypothetical protein
MHFATHGTSGDKPAVLEISKAVTRGHPDPPTVVLKQRLWRIIRQSTRFPEDGSLSILPPRQTLVSANPNAAIRRCEHGLSSIAGQTLSHGNSTNGELSKPVESSSAGDPDSAFTILEKTKDDVA